MRKKQQYTRQVRWAAGLIAGAALMAPVQSRAGIGDIDSGEVQIDLSRYESVQLRPGQNPDLAVAVSLPGGGHRSSNCAAGMLLALEQVRLEDGSRSLLEEIDYFSTVSGGGCTTGVYLAALRDHMKAHGTPDGFSFARMLQSRPHGPRGRTVAESLAGNYQKIIRDGLLHDLVPGRKDRGDHFESFLDEELLRGLTFADMLKPRGSSERPTLPCWIPVSTIDRNAAIFPHAPDIYATYQLTEYRHQGKTRRFDGDYFDVPMSVGLKGSLSFPIAVPPTVFKSALHPDRPYIHLKDGGLADNVGCITAMNLLRQDRAARKVMIVIDVNITKLDPWVEGTKAGGFARQAFDSSRIAIDSRVHRYREQMVTSNIHRDASGRICCGKTLDGIEVIFLYPELLSKDAALRVKAVGTTLKIDSEQQQLLFGAGWEIVRLQSHRLRAMSGQESSGMVADIGSYELSNAATAGQAGKLGERGDRGRRLFKPRPRATGGSKRKRW